MADRSEEREWALAAPVIDTAPGAEYAERRFQGIPGIERAPGGRLWATWYGGGEGEGPENYVVLLTSGDDGRTWSGPALVIDPPGKVRAFDPALWVDPLGRLWLFWAQSYEWFDGRAGVWAIRCDNPDSDRPHWSAPRRLTNGVMMNKPTALSTGEWLLPAAVWECQAPRREELSAERFSNVLVSADAGESWCLRCGADVPERSFDEHMVVERRDGTLWMLVRAKYGVGESVSTDGGRTWSPGRRTEIAGPDSRFFIRRLRSGRLLLVNHYQFTKRNNLTAMLSEDDGRTWRGALLLDERNAVSYPDGTQAEDGRIYVIYDRERTGAREILMAVFTEEDVIAGRPVSPGTRLKALVHRASQSARRPWPALRTGSAPGCSRG